MILVVGRLRDGAMLGVPELAAIAPVTTARLVCDLKAACASVTPTRV